MQRPHNKEMELPSLRKPFASILAAGVITLMVGASGVALADSAPSGTAQSPSAKRAPVIPAGADAAIRPQGSTAAATSRTGTPSERLGALASQDGACEIGDLCLYYLYDYQGWGSGYDTAHNDPNLFNNHFIFGGSGQGAIVGSNARAYWNRDPYTYAYVCTGTYSTGSCGWLAPNAYGNLNSTYADRSQSLYWGDSSN
jgi:peptidase inhibitor family I36